MFPTRPRFKLCTSDGQQSHSNRADPPSIYREITRAPVIWSHSAARHYNNISRNVPDYILKKIGSGSHQVDGVVMVNIYPAFMLPADKQDYASVSIVADHVEWMANLMGKKQSVVGGKYVKVEADGNPLVRFVLQRRHRIRF